LFRCRRPATGDHYILRRDVRYQGIIHDFVMLNALRETHAAEAAIAQAIAVLRKALSV
jgi:hypothetical protein